VLTCELLPGRSLAELLAAEGAGAEPDAGSPQGARPSRRELAHRLGVVWLRQAVLGGFFPAELSPRDVTLTPDRRVGLTGGHFASLSPESRENLWAYLTAAAGEDPSRACSYLVSELERDDPGGNAEVLRQRFRQLVPFRDGGWGDGTTLADNLFAHWKLAGECGYVPRGGLPAFYRGLYLTAESARGLAPERDALLEALQDVRLIEGMERFRALIGPDQLGAQMNRYAAAALLLPQRLDEALALGAAGGMRLRLQVAETPEQRRRKNASARLTALLLALAAVALLTQRFADTPAGPWVERAGAVAFVLLGALLLRAANRG
jgi:hypothetical protein